jgi:acylglycerol lipase
MGALLINSFLINNPLLNISGVILSNPLIKIPRSTNLNGYKGYIVKLLAKDLKDLVINSMINISALTKDSYHIMKIVKDRLVFPFMSFSFVK